jgi:hypothetical protein
MKYVTFLVHPKGGKDGKLFAHTFSSMLVHAEVSKAMVEVMKRTWPKHVVRPVHAGEVSLLGHPSCSGESTTLNLKSRPEIDDVLLSINMDYGGNWVRIDNKGEIIYDEPEKGE